MFSREQNNPAHINIRTQSFVKNTIFSRNIIKNPKIDR